jgi:hypothetical protein
VFLFIIGNKYSLISKNIEVIATFRVAKILIRFYIYPNSSLKCFHAVASFHPALELNPMEPLLSQTNVDLSLKSKGELVGDWFLRKSRRV